MQHLLARQLTFTRVGVGLLAFEEGGGLKGAKDAGGEEGGADGAEEVEGEDDGENAEAGRVAVAKSSSLHILRTR